MKSKNIAYWITTILVAFPMASGGVMQVARVPATVEGFVHILHYPAYFVTILGVWKVLGAIAILVPRFPRLKEWAYAGIIFDLTGAAASNFAVGGYGAYGFHILAPLIIAGHDRGLLVSPPAQPQNRHPHSNPQWRSNMKIKVTTLYVDDQEKALRFYTDVLGFVKKTDFSQGPYRWLTIASPEEPDGTEVQLALNNNPAAKTYQQALFQQNQPAAMFFTDDLQADYDRMKASGAEFTMPPTDVTASKIAMLNDTCGNLIQVTELKRW